ncbi:MAG: tetratricopeptide repeat protein, partial [Planctomycetota bacterium]|nr:tetratricopeptide repeat protein [Planctomycetota bacterium]
GDRFVLPFESQMLTAYGVSGVPGSCLEISMESAEYDALVRKARKAFQKKDLIEAIDLFEEALEIRPDDIDVHEALATACYLAQDHPGAIKHFTRLTQLKPRDSTAWVNLGAIHNLREEYQQAIVVLRKGIQRDGKNAEAYYNLGIAQKSLAQTSMAVSAYRESVRLDPDNVDAHVNLANIYMDQVNHRKAKQHYEQALRVNPDFDRAKRGLARAEEMLASGNAEMANPFGRLVDTARLAERNAAANYGPPLTEEERFADRQLIQLATAESGNQAAYLLKHLVEHVEPALLSVTRLISQNASQQRGMYESRQEFHEATRFLNELFANWQVEFYRLKQNEEDLAARKP